MHHFGSKETLLAEVLKRRDAIESVDGTGVSLLEGAQHDLAAGLGEVIRHNASIPGIVQLYTRLSAEATDPAHDAHEYFRDRFERARNAYAVAVADAQADGRLSAEIDARVLAIALVALVDGLQTQWMFEPGIEMDRVVDALLRALTRPGQPHRPGGAAESDVADGVA